MTYFAGAVLPPTDSQVSKDPTFRFTKKQSEELDLVGIPVRLEHNPKLNAGKIIQQFNRPDGTKYVIGKIDDENSGIVPMFASNAVKKDANGAYYPSLSLQHSYDLRSGERKGIEVSLVCKPRRGGCDIKAIHQASDREKNSEYKPTKSTPLDHQMSTEDKIETPTETPVVEQTKQTTEPETANATENVNVRMDEALEVMMKQQQELENLRQQQKAWNEEKVARKEEEKKKANLLLKSVAKLWDSQVDNELWTGEQKDGTNKRLAEFANEHPKIAQEVFTLAHCASSKFAESQAAYDDLQKQQDEIGQKLGHVMKKRKVVHAASSKAEPEIEKPEKKSKDPSTLMRALNEFGGVSGSGRSLMEQLYNSRKDREQNIF